MIAGVCTGLAEYFEADVTLIRLAFMALTFAGGAGVVVYIVGAVIMPDKTEIDKM